MKRALLLLIIGTLNATPIVDVANTFASVYGQWAGLRNARVQNPGTVSAPEMEAWQKVKTFMRQLEKCVDAEYRGER